jgi:hypothetical protein
MQKPLTSISSGPPTALDSAFKKCRQTPTLS